MSWIAVGVGAVGLAGSLASNNAGSGPKGRNYGSEMNTAMNSQADIMGPLLGYEQQWQPRYGTLGQMGLEQMLFGSAAQDPVQAWQHNKSGAFTLTAPKTKKKQWTETTTGGAQAAPGLLAMYGRALPQLTGMQTAADSQARGAAAADYGAIAPQYQAAWAALNPELAALQQQMGADAQRQMALGGQIGPEEQYRITSGVRNNWANRGLGASNPAMLSEAMQLFGGGEALRAQRQQYGMNTISGLAATTPDYYGMTMGPQSPGVGALGGLTQFGYGMSQDLGPRLLQPESQYFADLKTGNIERKMAYQQARKEGNQQAFGGLMSMAGGMMG